VSKQVGNLSVHAASVACPRVLANGKELRCAAGIRIPEASLVCFNSCPLSTLEQPCPALCFWVAVSCCSL
jgi:hypothetical protein